MLAGLGKGEVILNGKTFEKYEVGVSRPGYGFSTSHVFCSHLLGEDFLLDEYFEMG